MIFVAGIVCLLLGLALGWWYSSALDLAWANSQHERFMAIAKQRDEAIGLMKLAIAQIDVERDRAQAIADERADFAVALSNARKQASR